MPCNSTGNYNAHYYLLPEEYSKPLYVFTWDLLSFISKTFFPSGDSWGKRKAMAYVTESRLLLCGF